MSLRIVGVGVLIDFRIPLAEFPLSFFLPCYLCFLSSNHPISVVFLSFSVYNNLDLSIELTNIFVFFPLYFLPVFLFQFIKFNYN
jgi:hypothetical protein